MNNAILLISCKDQKGVTATVTTFIFQNNGNIIDADQHIDEQTNTFFMRVEWSLDGFAIGKESLKESFAPIARKFGMSWELSFGEKKANVAIFVSRQLHCLYDLLLRHREGQLACELSMIISNHPDAKKTADDFEIPFYEFVVTGENKEAQELEQLSLLQKTDVDLIVLARYHQILTPRFVGQFENRIINIHHSFLPAFPGSNPYDRAYRKGVKIVGATSHFVIPELDQGPIIEQDTVRISHRDSVSDLKRKGQDLEKLVLSRAVRWFLERKILTYGNKTVVFD